MADVSETPEEAQYSMNEVEQMDRCGVLPEDFKRIKEFENEQFDRIHWPSFLVGIEAGARQCLEVIGQPETEIPKAMRDAMYMLMKTQEKSEFRGKHMRNHAELMVNIITGKTDPKEI